MMFKRVVAALALAAGLMILTPPAQAQADSGWWSRWNQWRKQRSSWIQQNRSRKAPTAIASRQTTPAPKPSSATSVPELDPTAAGSALVLLIGGVAYIAARRREEHDLT